MRHSPLSLFALLLLGTTSPLCAQGRIEHITPPVLQRGKTTRIEIVGRALAPALDVWNTWPKGEVRAKVVQSSATVAVVDMTVSATADVGMGAVRLATRDGLTNLHLLLIDDLPVREPSASVTLPAAIAGTFREAEADRFRIEVSAGKMSFEIVASRFGKDADPLLIIRDASNRIVVERDNEAGLYYDCRFEHDFKEAGTYTVEVRDSRYHCSPHHQYVLRMGRFPPTRVAMPSAVSRVTESPHAFFEQVQREGDEGTSWVPATTTTGVVQLHREVPAARARAFIDACSPATTLAFQLSPGRVNPFLPLERLLRTGPMQATCVTVPATWCGVLRQPGVTHAFTFHLAKGQKIVLRGEAKALNSPVDLDLVLTDRFGREVRRGTATADEVTLDFTAGNAGTHGLLVRDLLRDGGESFSYRITVMNDTLPPMLMAEVEGLTIPQGSYQPIPIVVNRRGNTGPIKLTLSGDHSGLTFRPEVIPEGVNEIVCQLHASKEAVLGVRSLQIIATVRSHHLLVQTQPLVDRQLVNVDLIPHALREDQKRLPPAVADRLAVQITPPSPFAFELPEPTLRLPRYQHADIPLAISRQSEFHGPITFTAKGGQLADKNEGRTRVYAEFPEATKGRIVSKILSDLKRARIEVAATGIQEDRRITLTRTFELNVTTAFQVGAIPAKVSLLPGEATKITFTLERVPSFAGEVVMKLPSINQLELPETLRFAARETSATIDVRVSPDANPGKHNLQWQSTGTVDGFEEESRGGTVEIEIRKVEPAKKK